MKTVKELEEELKALEKRWEDAGREVTPEIEDISNACSVVLEQLVEARAKEGTLKNLEGKELKLANLITRLLRRN